MICIDETNTAIGYLNTFVSESANVVQIAVMDEPLYYEPAQYHSGGPFPPIHAPETIRLEIRDIRLSCRIDEQMMLNSVGRPTPRNAQDIQAFSRSFLHSHYGRAIPFDTENVEIKVDQDLRNLSLIASASWRAILVPSDILIKVFDLSRFTPI
jgi:hypothetical protein